MEMIRPLVVRVPVGDRTPVGASVLLIVLADAAGATFRSTQIPAEL